MAERDMAAHEDYGRTHEIRTSSDRTFGLFFGAVFCAVAAWQWWSGSAYAGWWLLPGAAFAAAGLIAPRALAPLNRAWAKLGLVLFYVVNPLVLGILFYLVFLPIGLLLRLAGKDLLRLTRDPGADTYWIKREPPGPAPDSMKNQF